MTIKEEIKKLADKLGYSLSENIDSDNNCFIAGNEIFIGKYENDEYLLISFFHEHGHKLVSQSFIKSCNYNTLLIEIEAWNMGIKAAMKLGYYFSDDAIVWAYKERALSYERENSNWSEKYKPKLWKYQKSPVARS